jgi:membrane associated rhomboid family serine protease
MTTTSVGMRCPECSRERTKVRTAAHVNRAGSRITVTMALIAINVIAYVGEGGGISFSNSPPLGSFYIHGALFGPLMSHGHQEYWRLVTSGFLHINLLHIGFNMYLLWILGKMMEGAVGPIRFGTIYFVALLAGSCGALIVDPTTPTVGASGAVFGLMGAAFVELRARGIDPFQVGIGGLIVFNLILSFAISGISIGGHIGGLIGGALCGLLFTQVDRKRLPAAAAYGACFVLAVASVAGALAAAGQTHSVF